MDVGAVDLAVAAARVVAYSGFVMLAGTLMFWVLVWPSGSRQRRLVLLALGGSLLVFLATVAEPLLRLMLDGDPASALPPVEGTALIVRVALLACLAGFFTDLLNGPIVGWRRVAVVAVVLILTATLVVPTGLGSEALERVGSAVAGAAHLLGAAAWLGGLAALTALIVAKEDLNRLESIVPRFTKVAVVALLVLVASGAAEALAGPGDAGRETGSSSYVAILVAKAVMLALMVLLAAYGRWYAKDMAFRRLRTPEQAAANPAVRRLTAVMQVELVAGLGLLVASSALVMAGSGA